MQLTPAYVLIDQPGLNRTFRIMLLMPSPIYLHVWVVSVPETFSLYYHNLSSPYPVRRGIKAIKAMYHVGDIFVINQVAQNRQT